MKSEIEAKFVNIDIDTMRQTLSQVKAKLVHPMRDMRRITIDTREMKSKNAYIRIRDQGDKTTLTYKQFDTLSLDGAKELEVEISDFDTTVEIFKAAGLPYGSFQESRRETWQLGPVEIVIDEWPWLNPYIEVEGPSQQSVIDTAKQLGLNWDDAVFGDVMAAYRIQYPHISLNDTVGNLENVRFSDPLPGMFKNS